VQDGGKAGYRAIAARAKRAKPGAQEMNRSTADHEEAEPAAVKFSQPEDTGLGWPG
jgi:hypothetical protein